MLKFFRLMIIIFVFSLTVFSQSKKDLQEWNLRAGVHQINYYDVYKNPESKLPNATERSLSGIDVFNRNGNLRVRFEFSRNGKDCSYKKRIYSYDAKNRKISAALYQSEMGENICPNIPPVFRENNPENLDGKFSFVEKTIYEYEWMDKITREIIFDRNNKIVQQNNYTYNRRGENTGYTITQQENRISGSSDKFVKTLDFRMFYPDNGKTQETYRYEDGRLIGKEVYYKDNQKRIIKGENFNLYANARNTIIKEIIGSRSESFFDGNKELFSWTIYDRKGDLQTQLYILSENDEELMRLEYNYRNQANKTNRNSAERLTHYQFENVRPEIVQRLKYILKFDECVENPNWIPARFENKFYKFDANGNVVQYSSQKRDAPSEKIKNDLKREKDITYYK